LQLLDLSHKKRFTLQLLLFGEDDTSKVIKMMMIDKMTYLPPVYD